MGQKHFKDIEHSPQTTASVKSLVTRDYDEAYDIFDTSYHAVEQSADIVCTYVGQTSDATVKLTTIAVDLHDEGRRRKSVIADAGVSLRRDSHLCLVESSRANLLVISMESDDRVLSVLKISKSLRKLEDTSSNETEVANSTISTAHTYPYTNNKFHMLENSKSLKP